MARSTLPLYPTDDGWPYPDSAVEHDQVDDVEVDLDRLELIADHHAFDSLSSLERHVISRRFGFDGRPASMKELAAEFRCTHAEAAAIVGGAVDKLRVRLTG